MPAPSPVFVAGTGRSGTSRIADIIGEHPLIHRIPMETKFLIDPGGLRDLADALTDRYDPTVGEDALHRLSAYRDQGDFDRLMAGDIAGSVALYGSAKN